MLILPAPEDNEKEWENPHDPEAPTDERDEQQIKRQYEEAKRRRENLTDEDNKKNNQTT